MADVTVIIPNYNHGPYLEHRIQSVIEQNYPDFEVIILDDASTDNSCAIIDSFRNHPRIKEILLNDSNTGTAYTQWKKGIELADGCRYLWIAESDDYSDPGFLQATVDFLESHPSSGLVFCRSLIVDQNDNSIGSSDDYYRYLEDSLPDESIEFPGEFFVDKFLIHKCVIPNVSSVLFRKATLDKHGLISADIGIFGDWLLYMNMAINNPVGYVPDLLNYYRIHEQSFCGDEMEPRYKDYAGFRKEVNEHLKGKVGPVWKEIREVNRNYMSQEIGRYGLHQIEKENIWKGIMNTAEAAHISRKYLHYSRHGMFWIKERIWGRK